jgi:hypothetical protein
MMATNPTKKTFTFDDLIKDHWIPEQEINDNMNRSIRWADDNRAKYLDGRIPSDANLLDEDFSIGKKDDVEKDKRVPNKIYFHLRNKWHNPGLNDSPTDLYKVEALSTDKYFFDKKLNKETQIFGINYKRVEKDRELFSWLP